MRKFLIAAFVAAATPALAQAPAAPPAAPASAVPNTPKEWSVVVMTADVGRGADEAWRRIGGDDYCAFVMRYLGTNSCVLTVGTGGVGTNRLLNGTINELLVAKTSHSYTYAQPTSPIFYHGTMAVEAVDSGHSRIVYTLLYDEAPLQTAEAKAANREQRRARFQPAIDKMAAAANAN